MKHHGICLGIAMFMFACLSSGCSHQAAGHINGSAATLPLPPVSETVVFQGAGGTSRVYSPYTPTASVQICTESDFQNLSRLTCVKDLTIFSDIPISGLVQRTISSCA